MKKSNVMQTAIAGILVLGAATLSTNVMAVPDQPANWEKCSGISKAGMNDCGALDGSHGCASQAKADNSAQEWVYLPEGTCTKVGGSVAAVKPAKS